MMKKITFFLASFIIIFLVSCSKEENVDESTSNEILTPISNDDAFLIPFGTKIIKDSLEITLKLRDFDLEINFEEIHLISLFFEDSNLNEMKPLAYIDLDKDYRISYEGGNDLEELDYTIYIESADGTSDFGSSFELKNLTVIGLNIYKIRDIPTGTLDYRDYNELVDYFNLQD